MFNLCLCNAATIRYSLLKFGHMHLCGKDYKYFSPHCCKCNSFGCIAAIRCVNACHGPHSDNVYSGSEHRQFNSPRLVKREAGFPNPRRALIGSNQLWRVNDSPYYRELVTFTRSIFQREQNHLFTLYVIFSYWHGTGWNSSSSKTRKYLFCMVNIMGADVLATQGARASATTIFTMKKQINSVPTLYPYLRSL